MSIFITRIHELAEIKAELAERDWFMGTSGNLSIKIQNNPLQFLVTASGKDKRKSTNEDFLIVDKDGRPVGETNVKPSAETLLHCEIYERSNAGCSLHVHTVANNVVSELYGDEGKVVFKGQELIKAFGRWEEDAEWEVPIIDNYAEIPRLAAALAPYVKADQGAVLIRSHGITVWGKDGFEAKKVLEACEFLFEYHLALLQAKANLQAIKQL
ncbi:methylthioribulose 1-phosphate dehydratase [Bacillus badius]|uniref:Methylthioribulose-1-phosphate dehydratase n=1 Tax=Bacillus badius TaxID=1455 RepID=A0ABR5ASQ9_BACBA|nr:methylthioribulose 1-phosphate dehydratase [Bacillus badius]KIL77356.1 Methylthioribulose-1-phosphate dehydratase [Bacillus badius]KZO01020.1 methylthioribulose-1-phosphate dehydratase [Bacillus badius]MED0665187.1 methylthioribulose 1-phosphate dehydratase [Bacillus badius]MED4718577.1 methylthioribulose 1-phosphate dehydratase [Bacillus badius]OCS89056.1 methylthioribulose-1-phosphate dehydratase [Bacillus badius]